MNVLGSWPVARALPHLLSPQVILEKAATSESSCKSRRDVPPWVSLSTQGSNVLLRSGLDARFSVYGHLSPASLQRCPPRPQSWGRMGGPSRLSEPQLRLCSVFSLGFCFFGFISWTSARSLKIKSFWRVSLFFWSLKIWVRGSALLSGVISFSPFV